MSAHVMAFLLIPEFPLLSYASAVEPLRAANVLSGRTLYRWQHLSVDGRPAVASCGVAIAPDHRVGEQVAFDSLFVCAGGNPARFDDQRTLAWLRRLAARGMRIGGISGGPYVLARARLLQGYRCTLHWEHAPAFREEFPDHDLQPDLYEIDRDRLIPTVIENDRWYSLLFGAQPPHQPCARYPRHRSKTDAGGITCGDGTAALDMMHDLIAREHGPDLALRVSEWFLQTQVREGTAPQRMALPLRTRVTDAAVVRAMQEMERRIEDPATPSELAAQAGVSVRQLERLFRRHLGTTPGAHYMGLRLEQARKLLHQTSLSGLQVALACGFANASHFSRIYRARFGHPPRAERGRPGTAQMAPPSRTGAAAHTGRRVR